MPKKQKAKKKLFPNPTVNKGNSSIQLSKSLKSIERKQIRVTNFALYRSSIYNNLLLKLKVAL